MNLTLSSLHARTRRSNVDGDRDATGSRHVEPSSPGAPATRRVRRSRRAGLLAGAALVAVIGTGCFPTGPVETWVPDFDKDGAISATEVEFQKHLIVQQFADAIEADRRAVQSHPFLSCVRAHESGGDYRAQNSRSSASGGYQFLDSTWRNASARAGHAGYGSAAAAPWWVQDAVALHMYNNGGRSAWNGTGC
ncbi:MAG: transglycosylase family protein [Microthrixaceae bacterium]